jgi:hypothetical protein
MTSYLRRKALRKIASALLDGFSARELKEIADRLLWEQSFQGELADVLHRMSMMLTSMKPQPASSSAMQGLSQRQRGWVREVQNLAHKGRLSKRALHDTMVLVSPRIQGQVIGDRTVPEMLAAYASAASENEMEELLELLRGPKDDAYLAGIMKRNEDRR